ncbi:MAG: hypothetical protein IKE52_02465 [Mogibacterium sp.]|nr:hypothetical protein [Mogibacterium sp.]
MLKYRLVKRENGKNLYEYMPDGNGRPGLVALHDNGTREIVSDSPDDFKRVYMSHAFSGIDINKDVGIVAWY